MSVRLVLTVAQGKWAGIPYIANLVDEQALWPTELLVNIPDTGAQVLCRLALITPHTVRYVEGPALVEDVA